MGLMTRNPNRTDFLRKRRRDTDLGYVGRDPRTFGGGRAEALARAPGPPKRLTDTQLGAAGRTGADRQAYLARQRLERPGGRQAAAQKIWAPPAGSGGSYNYPIPPPAQTVVPGAGPSTPFSAERMKATVQGGRGVPGSQYEGAGAMGGRTVRDWQSPEGRYVGPGAPAGAVTQDRLGMLQGRLAQAESVEALGRPSRAGFLRQQVGSMRGRIGGEAATLGAEGEARRGILAAATGRAEAETATAGVQTQVQTRIGEAVQSMTDTGFMQWVNSMANPEKAVTFAELAGRAREAGNDAAAQWLDEAAVRANGGQVVELRPEDFQGLAWLYEWIRQRALGGQPERRPVFPTTPAPPIVPSAGAAPAGGGPVLPFRYP